ncbi:TetR/AcrR family transcriptional regulator [Mycobacteroides abscessus]
MNTRGPNRSDARENRARILEVALAELTRSADTPLTTIARKAGVGQGTLYRHFPTREALIMEAYQHESQLLADSATELLETCPPDQALRQWMDKLSEYALTKTALSKAISQGLLSPGPTNPSYPVVSAAIDRLLRANEDAGLIRAGVTADDFILATAGIWMIDADTDWKNRATRLLNFVMDGLRVGVTPRTARKRR